jgi:GST-like protein
MIDLYYWPTPNGWKITIFLEETGTPYRIVPVNIGKGEQFTPEFLKISPNNRMPAIVDPDGPDGKPIALFESGAILIYLGEKTGRFWPREPRARYDVLQWVMFQMANVGPMFGQAGHFLRYAPEKIPYAIERYTNEVRRLCRVLDERLAGREFIAGEYSIADMATFPWVHAVERSGAAETSALAEMGNLARWMATMRARPAVERGLAVLRPDPSAPPPQLSDEARSILFGARQAARR